MSEDTMNEEVQEDVVQEEDAPKKASKKRGRPKASKPKVDEVPATNSVDIAALQAQVSLLTKALFSARNEPQADDTTPVIGVMKVGGPEISMRVTDLRGNPKYIVWQTDQQVEYLTEAQYEEAIDTPASNRFFEREWLALETDENVALADPAAWLDQMEIDDIFQGVQDFDDITSVTRILNHIESARIITEDENGEALKDDEGLPMAKVIQLSPKQRLAAEACVTAIYDRTGMRYSLNDG